MKRHGIALAAVLFAAGNAHAALDNAAAQALMQKDGCAAVPCDRQEGRRPLLSGRRRQIQGRQGCFGQAERQGEERR